MEIWEDIAANAEDGAKRLVAEYGDRLFSAAVRICGNDCDAEALVFRTLSHAIAKIGQYGKRSSFFSWLYSILANFHRMDMRKKGSTDLGLAVAASLEPKSAWKLPHGYAVAIGILADISAAIKAGDPREDDLALCRDILDRCGALDGLRHSRHILPPELADF